MKSTFRSFISLLLLTVFSDLVLSAQDEETYAFQKGNLYLSIGAGVPNQNSLILKPILNEQDFSYQGRGPFHFKAEYALLKNLGIGISVNRVAFDARFKVNNPQLAQYFDYRLRFASSSFLLRLNGQVPLGRTTSIYGGAGIGFKTGRPKLESEDPMMKDFSFPFMFPVGLELTAGFRWMPVPYLGLYVETGMAKSFIQTGLSFSVVPKP
ncbi:MAG: hypothetical protein RL160_186 [Bacteroidota bacterium]|jgi:hypothetical protein